MRLALTVLAALALASCGAAEGERCDITVSRDISFTSADAADVVTARAFGAACDRVALLYVVSDAEERPIWAWASPMPRAFGEFAADEPDEIRSFLERWTQPDLLTTAQAPQFGDLTAGQTTLDQFTYEDIRARELPMLCHFSGTAEQTCVFWEPAAGGAGLFFNRSVEESSE